MKLRDLDSPLQTILMGLVLTIAMLYSIAMREGHFFFPDMNYAEVEKKLQIQSITDANKSLSDQLEFQLESLPVLSSTPDGNATKVAYVIAVKNISDKEIRLNLEMFQDPQLLDPYSANTNFAGIPDDTPPVILKPNGSLVMSFNSIFKDQDRMGTEELDRFNKNHLKFNIYARINGKKFYGRIDLTDSNKK